MKSFEERLVGAVTDFCLSAGSAADTSPEKEAVLKILLEFKNTGGWIPRPSGGWKGELFPGVLLVTLRFEEFGCSRIRRVVGAFCDLNDEVRFLTGIDSFPEDIVLAVRPLPEPYQPREGK